MMKSSNTEFSDKVYEMALSEIQESFDDITVDLLRGMTYDRMPIEVRSALDKAQGRFNLENEIYPISSSTDSKDGVTCDWCHEKLVVKTSTVSSSAGIYQKKILSCPTGGMKCRITFQQNEFESLIKESSNLLSDCKLTYTMNTRDHSVKRARLILESNIKNGFKVTAPNTQMTELIFGTEVLFDTKEKIVSKTGKVIEYVTCEHGIDKHIDAINKSEIYNVIKVEKIGNLCILHEFSKSDRCYECRSIGNNIENELDVVKKEIALDRNDEQYFQIEHSFNKDIVYYRMTVQRIDNEIPKVILKVLGHRRFQDQMYDYLLSDEVTRLVINEFSALEVSDNLKSKVTAQLKSLYNKNLLEIQVDEHIFSQYRYDKVHTLKAQKEGEVNRYFKNENYVGNATKINSYRISDNSVTYLTKKVLDEIKTLDELKRRPSTIINGRQWSFEEVMWANELWIQIRKQYGVSDDVSLIYNQKYGIVWVACLSGIKRQRKR